jgi:hypothetical protein
MKNIVNIASRSCFVTVFFIMIWCLPTYADMSSSDKWEFQLAPYVWMAGLEGKVATLPNLPPAEIDADFSDVVKNLDGALMLVGEVSKGRYGLFMDFIYINIEAESSTPGPVFSSIESETESFIVSSAGFYRLFQEQRTFVDIMAGIRYWNVDSDLLLDAGLVTAREISHCKDWFDPFIGLKGLLPLRETSFFVSGGGVIGGFRAGSDFMLDAYINLGYQWTKSISAIFGYRYLSVDYEDNGFLYDVSQNGPVIGLSWRF